MLKENGYQKSIISKISKIITNIHNLSQSQQQTQPTDILQEDIRMTINFLYIEGTRVYSNLTKSDPLSTLKERSSSCRS